MEKSPVTYNHVEFGFFLKIQTGRVCVHVAKKDINSNVDLLVPEGTNIELLMIIKEWRARQLDVNKCIAFSVQLG